MGGTEWYFGYRHDHSDLTCQDFRSRDLFWDQCEIAVDFFQKNNIPFWQMECMDELTKSENDYVFAKTGEVYLVYSKTGEKIELVLPDLGYNYLWLNPKTGESKKVAKETKLKSFQVECPSKHDWLLYLYK